MPDPTVDPLTAALPLPAGTADPPSAPPAPPGTAERKRDKERDDTKEECYGENDPQKLERGCTNLSFSCEHHFPSDQVCSLIIVQ